MKRVRQSLEANQAIHSPPTLRSKRKKSEIGGSDFLNVENVEPQGTNDQVVDVLENGTEVDVDSEDAVKSETPQMMSTPPDASKIGDEEQSNLRLLSDAPAKHSAKQDPEESDSFQRARKSPIKLFGSSDSEIGGLAAFEGAGSGTSNVPNPQPKDILKDWKPLTFIKAGVKTVPMGKAKPLVRTSGSRGAQMLRLLECKNEEGKVNSGAGSANVERDEEPVPPGGFDSGKPWMRYHYSPGASPGTSILKVSPSPKNTGQRSVRFHPEIDTVEFPAEGNMRSLSIRRGLSYDKAKGQTSEDGPVNPPNEEDNAEKGAESPDDVPETEPSRESEKVDEKPGKKFCFYPELLNCQEPVQSILREITGSHWLEAAVERMVAWKCHTIGDFVQLTEQQLEELPIASGKLNILDFIKKKLGLFVDGGCQNTQTKADADTNTEKPTAWEQVEQALPKLTKEEKKKLLLKVLEDKDMSTDPEVKNIVFDDHKASLAPETVLELSENVSSLFSVLVRDTEIARAATSTDVASLVVECTGPKLVQLLKEAPGWSEQFLFASAKDDCGKVAKTVAWAMEERKCTAEGCPTPQKVTICEELLKDKEVEQVILNGTKLEPIIEAITPFKLESFFGLLKEKLGYTDWSSFRSRFDPETSFGTTGTQSDPVTPGAADLYFSLSSVCDNADLPDLSRLGSLVGSKVAKEKSDKVLKLLGGLIGAVGQNA